MSRLAFGLCWILEKSVPLSVKEALSRRIDGLARESEGKQAKSKGSFYQVH